MKNKYYFISYRFDNGYSEGNGYGNIVISMDNYINVTKMQTYLEEKYNCSWVVILYYKEISEKVYEMNKEL